MSGHSKWHNIKVKKGAADVKRGKIFTRHAKLITIAASEGGGDPSMNPSLRMAIINAKADNVPNANIEKAVQKGSGEGKDGAKFEEIMYGAFGPCGVAILIQSITDNKNRAVASIKTIVSKNGGNHAETSSIAWMFQRKGKICVTINGKSEEESELMIIESGAEDLEKNGEEFIVTTSDTSLMNVRESLEKAGFKISNAELTHQPKNWMNVDKLEDAQKVLKFIDALEEDDDVSTVYTNCDIAEEILDQI
ncbi:MAG: YebC/PmpR family DNA-binding transcriptional regulator [Candidatus Gracilibacteria bacterium]